MAILVIQLARFGDVFQTWPTLKALRRKFPSAEIHLLVRERFKEAAFAADDIGVIVHTMTTAEILKPIFEAENEEASLENLTAFVRPLVEKKFEKIVNLTFSPFSSYLTDALATTTTEVTGYTRHADGFLHIPDDSSAYFYAQTGIGKHNRYHVTEIFAAVAGVDLVESDFSLPTNAPVKSRSIIVHLGASQAQKTYPPEMWRDVLTELQNLARPVVVVGSSGERAMAETVCADLDSNLVFNRVGQSSLATLCEWVGEASLVIGADSAPVHIAALTATPVLNLSSSSVNFWETGPMSAGSRVLFASQMHEIDPSLVVREARGILEGSTPEAFAIRKNLLTGFELTEPRPDYFWSLLQALYTASDYPALPEGATHLGYQRLYDVADLALKQFAQLKMDGSNSAAFAILQSIDNLLIQIPQLDPNVAPVVEWFQTERVRIGPQSIEKIVDRTRDLFEQLRWIAAVYHKPAAVDALVERALSSARLCVPHLREFEFSEVNSHFQDLLSTLHDLGHHATKVGGQDWSSVLKRLTESLERRDLIDLADALEFELPIWLSREAKDVIA